MEPATSWFLVGFVSAVPRRELQILYNFNTFIEFHHIEIAKFMHYITRKKDKDCEKTKCEQCWCSCKDDAERLYNAGYRIKPKKAITIPTEECDEKVKETNKILSERDELKAENAELKSKIEELKLKCAALFPKGKHPSE